jgi:hypothetical protein
MDGTKGRVRRNVDAATRQRARLSTHRKSDSVRFKLQAEARKLYALSPSTGRWRVGAPGQSQSGVGYRLERLADLQTAAPSFSG